MLKHLEIADPKSCLNSAADDELVFTLRAHDPRAIETVEHWIASSEREGQHLSRLAEAREWVAAAREWRKEHADD